MRVLEVVEEWRYPVSQSNRDTAEADPTLQPYPEEVLVAVDIRTTCHSLEEVPMEAGILMTTGTVAGLPFREVGLAVADMTWLESLEVNSLLNCEGLQVLSKKSHFKFRVLDEGVLRRSCL